MSRQGTVLEVRTLLNSITQGPLDPEHKGPQTDFEGCTLTSEQGEILGWLGESGCGKTTLSRTILGS
jgi:ABC-type glutathione transport system ATPase component